MGHGYQQRGFGFVGGKALKRNGQLLDVDLKRIQKMAYECRDYVVSKSGFKLPQI